MSSKQAISPSGTYVFSPITTPSTVDETQKHTTTEIKGILTNGKPVGDICFVDDRTLLLSVPNGRNESNQSRNYDVYKYNFTNKTTALLCRGFMLYTDETINVKDENNFSIYRSGSYLEIKDGKVSRQDYFNEEAGKKGLSIADLYYNADNDKLLYTVSDKSGNTTGAYVSNRDFSKAQKLPFSGVYRVTWADDKHVLGACKKADKTELLKYNIDDKTTSTDEIPDKNYFLDPQRDDTNIIRFFYLEPQDKMPWGFMNLKTGTVTRSLFDSANPSSIMRSGRMAMFSQEGSYPKATYHLCLYDISKNTSTVRVK